MCSKVKLHLTFGQNLQQPGFSSRNSPETRKLLFLPAPGVVLLAWESLLWKISQFTFIFIHQSACSCLLPELLLLIFQNLVLFHVERGQRRIQEKGSQRNVDIFVRLLFRGTISTEFHRCPQKQTAHVLRRQLKKV